MDNTVGKPLDRVDGRLKVTGAAKYSAEYPLEGLVYAVIVTSTIAHGSVTHVDTQAAEQAPGVLAILSPDKPPKLALDSSKKQKPQDRVVHVMQTRKVDYQNQPVALVIADTLERATHAAALVKVQYRASKAKVNVLAERSRAYTPKPAAMNGRQADLVQGKAPTVKAAAQVDTTYTTPYEHHNPMEPHATTALWDGEKLTVYDATQGVFNVRDRLAALFGLPPENVRVITKFIGGGFGCKGSTWAHTVLAAIAARAVSRPVKLVLRREQMFGPVGFRPETHQRVRLQAQKDGKLLGVRHDVLTATSTFDEFIEPSAAVTRILYASEQISTSHRVARLNLGTPTFMRAPGEGRALEQQVPQGVLPRGGREVRLGEARPRPTLDEGRPHAHRLGHGHGHLPGAPLQGERPGHAPARWARAGRLRLAGPGHRRLHRLHPGGGGRARPAPGAGDVRPGRHPDAQDTRVRRPPDHRQRGLRREARRARPAGQGHRPLRRGHRLAPARPESRGRAGGGGPACVRRQAGQLRRVAQAPEARLPGRPGGRRAGQGEGAVRHALLRRPVRRGAGGSRPGRGARQPVGGGLRRGHHPQPQDGPESDVRRYRHGHRHGADGALGGGPPQRALHHPGPGRLSCPGEPGRAGHRHHLRAGKRPSRESDWRQGHRGDRHHGGERGHRERGVPRHGPARARTAPDVG